MSMEGNHFQNGKQSRSDIHSPYGKQQQKGVRPQDKKQQQPAPGSHKEKPQEEKNGLSGTSRQAEEAFLEQTLDVIRTNLENYGSQVSRMREEIDDMLDHFHDDNPELINLLENSMTLYEQMKRALERNERARNKPYFGRIDFYDELLEKKESIYIGKGGISRDATHQAVIDWRAPVANAYYENGLGKCSYTAPGDKEIPIDLKLKRTYEIENEKLLDYYDSEVVANDELLTKYLAKNKQAVLGEIIATIQKEQNDIIRKSPYHNIIVQGVAGSGKTTVAMHRISFILYNYQERFKPDDFYIVGSNRILLNYITGVLPDLDVYGIRQMTMEQLFVRLLYEDWDEKKYSIRPGAQGSNKDSLKGTSQWFEDLKEYCDLLEWNTILRESIYLNPKQYVEGLQDGKNGVYDTTIGKPVNPYDLIRLVDGTAVERYIRQNPKVSMQSKINMLNDRLIIKIKEEFLGKGVKYTEAERKAILKAYRGRYGSKIWKGSIYELYRDFLIRQADRGKAVDIPGHEFDVYDLAALAYLYKRIKETEVISEAHHIVIDEAQDFGMMAYNVLHFCIEACTYTIMGDVSQNIHFGFGLNDWEELRRLLLSDEMDSFGILKKSYRNTVEISDFATQILHHGRFSSYPVEPIIRHGDPVKMEQCSEEELFQKAGEICRQWQKKGFDTIAVVCRSTYSAGAAAQKLGQYIKVMENDLEKAVFGNGVMVLPVEYTKGLEFDTVLILDPTRDDYPVDDGHAKLLYVAATRALHELCILHTGELTGLIADPVPEGHRILEEGNGQEPDAAHGKKVQVTGSSNTFPGTEKVPGRRVEPSESEDENIGKGYLGKEKETCSTQDRFGRSEGRMKSLQDYISQPDAPCLRKTTKKSDQISQLRPSDSAPLHSNAPMPFHSGSEKKPDADFRSSQISAQVPRNAAGRPTAGIQRPRAALASSEKNGSSPQPPSALTSLYSARPVSRTGTATDSGVSRAGTDSCSGMSYRAEAASGKSASPPRPGTGYPAFGDIPPTQKLRPMGHSKIDLSVRWVTKHPDGLYLQSRYGTLRLSPVGSAIIRVTFAQNGQPDPEVHSGIAVNRTEKFWMYRDSGNILELTTDELALQTDKSTGAIQYLFLDEDSGRKKPLLQERKRECRQLETTSKNCMQTWLFLDFAKEEHLYAISPEGAGIPLKGTARYISRSDGGMPLLISDRGYGIVMAASSPVFCCDIPAYGSYLHGDSESQLDFYFIAGRKKDTLLNAYAYLCGKL